MDKFNRDYGVLGADGTYAITGSQSSILASAVQIGEFFGSLSAAFIGNAFGRKGAFMAAMAYVTIGVLIQIIPAGSVAALGTGRAILGMGVGVISNATPLYLSEVAHSSIRGIVVSSWQLMLAIGQVIGACVGQGTQSLETTAAYRIPIGINLVIVLLISLGLFVLPESPRWLLSKDRDEKAMKNLLKINSSQEDPEKVAAQEFQLFTQARRDEREAQGDAGWMSILRDPVERRKLICVVGILGAQQIGGVQFIFSYTTTFFSAVGVSDAFLVTIIVDIIEVVGVIVSFFLTPRFGRRPLLLWTSVPMVISLFVCGAMGCIDNRTTTQNRTIAGMICVFVFFFNLAWGPLAWVVASETATGMNRQRIMGLGTALFWVIAWAVTFTLPYLFYDDEAGLGAKVGFVYAPLNMLAMAFVYFYIPETFGRSLEEINEMLISKVPTRRWKGYVTSLERTRAEGLDTKATFGGHEQGSTSVVGEEGESELKKKDHSSSPLQQTHALTADADAGDRA